MARRDLTSVVEALLGAIKGLSDRLTPRIEALEHRQADRGEPGKDGRDGASFSAGHGAPTFEGKQNDYYLDLKTGDIYQCR